MSEVAASRRKYPKLWDREYVEATSSMLQRDVANDVGCHYTSIRLARQRFGFVSNVGWGNIGCSRCEHHEWCGSHRQERFPCQTEELPFEDLIGQEA